MGKLDSDYMIYYRFRSGAMRTVLKAVNESLGDMPITEQEIDDNPDILKVILRNFQENTQDFFSDVEKVKNLLDHKQLKRVRNRVS